MCKLSGLANLTFSIVINGWEITSYDNIHKPSFSPHIEHKHFLNTTSSSISFISWYTWKHLCTYPTCHIFFSNFFSFPFQLQHFMTSKCMLLTPISPYTPPNFFYITFQMSTFVLFLKQVRLLGNGILFFWLWNHGFLTIW